MWDTTFCFVFIEKKPIVYNNQEFSSKIRAKVWEAVGFELPGLRKVSSSLQEVENLPTRAYFPSRSRFGLD